MADNGTLEGSIDEAAAAIEALLSRPAQSAEAPAEGSDAEEQAVADQIQAKGADQPAQAATDTGEEAPEGDTPAELPAEGESLEAAVAEPEPVKPAPKVETPQAVVTQPQTNNLAQISQALSGLQIQIAAEFPDIRTQEDLLRLASSANPEDHARLNRFNVLRDIQAGAQRQLDAVSAQARVTWLAGEQEKLHKAIPDIADPVKGPALKAKLADYAIERGYTPEHVTLASASDIAMLHDAMMYRDGLRQKAAEEARQKAALKQAQEKAKDAPKVQKPGVAVPGPSKSVEKEQELLARIEKSGGKVNDVAALIEHRNR
jgi:hypothetical protein